MSELWPYALLSLVCCVVVFIAWMTSASERAFRRELQVREPLDDDTFYESFYATTKIPADIPRRLRPIYADFFGIDATKLRPLDRPPEIVDLDTVEILIAIEREFNVSISDADAEKLDGSFDSIVQYLAAVRAQSSSTPGGCG